jgi:hypothetical protein
MITLCAPKSCTIQNIKENRYGYEKSEINLPTMQGAFAG